MSSVKRELALPDFIAQPCRLLSIGINPSRHAAIAGYPFAFARNRFWPALNQSRLTSVELVPGIDSTWRLAREFGISFTDVVKRPTPGMKDLTAADFRRGALALQQRIEVIKPACLWIHGLIAMRAFAKHCLSAAPNETGWQDETFAGTPIFVSPNPSPANARFSLQDFVQSYDELAASV